jgi:zona occludens toxin (predicted ATPase)
MIHGYYGLPGSGKSLNVVEHIIIPALKAGRTVATNIRLKDKAYTLGGNIIPFESKVHRDELAKFPHGSVIVVDEAWRYCKSGERMTSLSEEFLELLTMHRHEVDDQGNETQLYFITQLPKHICSHIRDMMDYAYNIVKVEVGGISKYRLDVYKGDGSGVLEGEPIKQEFHGYNSDIFDYYYSSTKSDSVGSEKKLDKRGGILGSAAIKYGLPLAAIGLLLGIYFISSSFNTFFGEKTHDLPETDTVYVNPLGQHKNTSKAYTQGIENRQIKPVRAQATKSDFRVIGYIGNAQDKKIVIRHNNGHSSFLNARLCKPYLDSYACYFAGQYITPYTGQSNDSKSPTSLLGG